MDITFDEINSWSEVKLEIIREYAIPYMDIMRKNRFTAHYVDGFCGSGVHLSQDSRDIVPGSPLQVLDISKPFDTYHFVDLDGDKTSVLKEICESEFPDRSTEIVTGDCNEVLMHILPRFSRGNYDRLFCLLDPYGLHLKWDVIEKMGTMGIVDLILHFPIMDINRNAIWKNPHEVPQAGIERMNSFWGDETWKNIAYTDDPQQNLFGDPKKMKQENITIANAFKDRLKKHGKFEYVPNPIPMKNSRNAVVYYLFFASQNKTANKIANHLFNKYGEET